MTKNFYNLPPPWNPGYAIPDSVLDEGLLRRAFVTAETPRGTYDDPSIGNAGYAVPRYIDDEGYGQGAFVTKWLPRGYYGPQIPHYLDQTFEKIVGESPASGRGVVLKFETMGDSAPPYRSSPKARGADRFQQFGRRAAAAVITEVRKLPTAKRPAAMRQIMNAMDPRLYDRTIRYTNRFAKVGMRPQQALAHGLAAGITEGMLSELKKSGQSRRAPQIQTLPGLGCYGCAAALGAVTAGTSHVQAVLSSPPAEGSCSADGLYKWTNGAWVRRKAGETCTGPVVAGGPSQSTGAGTTVTATSVLRVGPGLEFPINAQRGSSLVFKSPSTLASSPELAAWIRTAWTTGSDKMITWDPTNLPVLAPWVQAVGIAAGQKINFQRVVGFVPTAAYKITNPTNGEEWGLWISLSNLTGTGQPKGGSVDLVITTRKPADRSLLSKALSAVATVAAPVAIYGGGIVAGALDIVSDLACGLVTSPGAPAAAAAASGGAAAVGVSIAAGVCAGPTPQAPPPEASSSDYTVPLLIGAGVIGTALVLSKRKKKP